jgi:hypothetical protein
VTITNQYLSGKYGLDAVGHQVYEPRDEQKGDAARAMFYMIVCYYGVDGYPWTLPTYLSTLYPYGQDQAVLKAWNLFDQPDEWEMARNDYIHSMQNNRNPFVDSLGWANNINFMNPAAIETYNDNNTELVTYPNPAKEKFFAAFGLESAQEVSVIMYDITGKLEFSKIYNGRSGYNTLEINHGLPAGLYMLNIKTDGKTLSKKIMID